MNLESRIVAERLYTRKAQEKHPFLKTRRREQLQSTYLDQFREISPTIENIVSAQPNRNYIDSLAAFRRLAAVAAGIAVSLIITHNLGDQYVVPGAILGGISGLLLNEVDFRTSESQNFAI